MKRGYLLISLICLTLILSGCSYARFKERAVKYLTGNGYSCSNTLVESENIERCIKEEDGITKTYEIKYEEDFYITLMVTKDDVTITIREDNITQGYGIPFYKGDTSYGMVYEYVKGSIDNAANKSYEFGAEVIDECREDLVIDNPTNKVKCDEVRKYLDLVNDSLKEFKEVYNENDIPITVELRKERIIKKIS